MDTNKCFNKSVVCLFVCFCLLVCCEGVYTQLLLLNKQVFYFSKNLHVYTYKLISQVLTASCERDSGFVLPSVQLDCKFRVCLATKPAGISTILPIWTFGLEFYDLINSFTHLAGICCFLATIIQLLSFWWHGFERDFDPSMSVIWITRPYLQCRFTSNHSQALPSCSCLVSQTHFHERRKGLGNCVYEFYSTALYSVVQSHCRILSHDILHH